MADFSTLVRNQFNQKMQQKYGKENPLVAAKQPDQHENAPTANEDDHNSSKQQPNSLLNNNQAEESNVNNNNPTQFDAGEFTKAEEHSVEDGLFGLDFDGYKPTDEQSNNEPQQHDKKYAVANLMNQYLQNKTPCKISLDKLEHGSFRKVTEAGKKKILSALKQCADDPNSLKNGIFETDPLIVIKMKDSDKYEVLDGNHRLAAFKEAGMNEYPCVVIDEIDERAKLVLAKSLNEKHDRWAVHATVFDYLNDLVQREESGTYKSGKNIISWATMAADMHLQIPSEQLRRHWLSAKTIMQNHDESWKWIQQQSSDNPQFAFNIGKFIDHNKLIKDSSDWVLLRVLKASLHLSAVNLPSYFMEQKSVEIQMQTIVQNLQLDEQLQKQLEEQFDKITSPIADKAFDKLRKLSSLDDVIRELKSITSQKNAVSEGKPTQKRSKKEDSSETSTAKTKKKKQKSKTEKSSQNPKKRMKYTSPEHGASIEDDAHIDLINSWFVNELKGKRKFNLIFCLAWNEGGTAYGILPDSFPPVHTLCACLERNGIIAILCPRCHEDSLIPSFVIGQSRSAEIRDPLRAYAVIAFIGNSVMALRKDKGPKVQHMTLHLLIRDDDPQPTFQPQKNFASDLVHLEPQDYESDIVKNHTRKFSYVPISFWAEFFAALFASQNHISVLDTDPQFGALFIALWQLQWIQKNKATYLPVADAVEDTSYSTTRRTLMWQCFSDAALLKIVKQFKLHLPKADENEEGMAEENHSENDDELCEV